MIKPSILLPALFVSLLAVACDGGYDTAEAESQCNDYRARVGACIDDAVFDECVLCFEDCGTECELYVNSGVCTFTCKE